MYIDQVKIWNFRKYGCLNEIDINRPNLDFKLHKGLNIIVGENDSGKTAIIDAIKLVLKTTSYEWLKLSYDDFYKGTNKMRIEIIIRDLNTSNASQFLEYLSYEDINGVKTTFLRLIFEAKIYNNRILTSDLKAGPDTNGKILISELREKLKATYLKPLRDAQSELVPKRNSRISQVFQEHNAFINHEEHMLLDLYKEFNTAVNYYFEGLDKTGGAISSDINGKLLKEELEKYIKDFFANSTEIDISTTQAEMRKILENLDISLNGIINPGLGSLNRLFMAVELLNLYKNTEDGLKLALIEEIEAHLHPQVQLKVIESILRRDNVQYIITTHSPNLASLVELEKIHICKNNSVYSLSPEYTQLENKNYRYLEKFLDVTKANIFFAKGLIFVEGWAEEILIPSIAKHIGYGLVENEVSLVNIGNLGFSNYYKIFSRKDGNHIDIPISIITDCDVREYIVKDGLLSKKETTEYLEECRHKTEKIGKTDFKPAQCFMTTEWTLEWCLYKSEIFKSKFIEVVQSVHSGTDWSKFEETLARKLIDQSLGKTEIAYKLADSIALGELTFDEESIKTDQNLKYIYEGIKNACK